MQEQTPKDPYLLTPGPLTTSMQTKEAMLRDWGSWDGDFKAMTATLRSELIAMIGPNCQEYDCVPMQGSGTFAVEAMLGSFITKNSKTLVLCNGAYGKRIVEILDYIQRPYVLIDKGDFLPPSVEEVEDALDQDPSIENIVIVHCETSSGILNPIEEIAEIAHQRGKKYLIDSMSSFGAVQLDCAALHCEAIVSSANKCIEGVPGFGFIIARKQALEQAKDNSHSLSLDVYAQWHHMNKTGQWRFTPPTHVVAAFLQALRQHRMEGGVQGRYHRYQQNRDRLVAGMRLLGFETLLDKRWLSPIIVTFFQPEDSNFKFTSFYDCLKKKGFIIYPGKLTDVDSFRIGCIGHIDTNVIDQLLDVVKDTLAGMRVNTTKPPLKALEERSKLQH